MSRWRRVCRKLGISEATFYAWKKYSWLGPVELRRLRQRKEENAQLKRIVADLTLDKQMLQDVLIITSLSVRRLIMFDGDQKRLQNRLQTSWHSRIDLERSKGDVWNSFSRSQLRRFHDRTATRALRCASDDALRERG